MVSYNRPLYNIWSKLDQQLVIMQDFNLIAQSVRVIPLQKRTNDDDNDDDDDTHPGWIIVRDGKYSVADKNAKEKTK